MSVKLQPIEPEYIYVTIPAEYVCVYHRILAMLADYGIDMLKDCKATCKDRNSGIIECFNMFNAAVAARKLGKNSVAATLIKYIKTKINQIYKNKDNSTSFVFPVDEEGQIKAFVSCGERPKFWIDPKDGELYEHKFDNGFDEHFALGPEDVSDQSITPVYNDGVNLLTTGISPGYSALSVILHPTWEVVDGRTRACADLWIKYAGKYVDPKNATVQYYFDNVAVKRFNDVAEITPGTHSFGCVVTYKGVTSMVKLDLEYEA